MVHDSNLTRGCPFTTVVVRRVRELRLHLVADGRHEPHHHLHLAGGEDGAEGGPDLPPLVPLEAQHLALPDLVRVRRSPPQIEAAESPVDEGVEILNCNLLRR